MFSNIIIDSDSFLDLSPMQQLLYFHCGMKTDDDGFVSGARRIARIIGATDDDFTALVNNGFLIEFPASKVCCIVHHRQNNELKNDRYHPTTYQQEFAQLELTNNKEWRLKQVVSNMDTDCFQTVSGEDTEHNVTQRNPKKRNPTEVSVEKGSDEGENNDSIMLLRYMAQQAGVTAEVEQAITDYGFSAAHAALSAWKADGQQKGKYKNYLKGVNE